MTNVIQNGQNFRSYHMLKKKKIQMTNHKTKTFKHISSNDWSEKYPGTVEIIIIQLPAHTCTSTH